MAMTREELAAWDVRWQAEREAREAAGREALLNSQLWVYRNRRGRWVQRVTQFGNSVAGCELVTVREARARGVEV